MATASINDIKGQIKSIEGTMQITKAMELVATSKLRHLKERAEESKPYMNLLSTSITEIATTAFAKECIYGKKSEGKTLCIVIAGDRGLAGGYNNNVLKLADRIDNEEQAVYLPIGRKAIEHCERKKRTILSKDYTCVADISVSDSLSLAQTVSSQFLKGEVSSVELIYTKFVSMLTQIPKKAKILPLEYESNKKDADKKEVIDPIFEGDPLELLEKIVPQYIGGLIYSAICEATASECAARRTAMNSANKNAEEMIDSLTLQFNRARQAVITQEITEIVSGAESL